MGREKGRRVEEGGRRGGGGDIERKRVYSPMDMGLGAWIGVSFL